MVQWKGVLWASASISAGGAPKDSKTKQLTKVSSSLASAVLAISLTGAADISRLTPAKWEWAFTPKMTLELNGQKRKARSITVDELETLLPSAKRYELIEIAKRTLYPELIFSTNIEPKSPVSASIFESIVGVFKSTPTIGELRTLRIQELSSEHLIQLLALTAHTSSPQANFAPLFAVGIHGEPLINTDIYQDQRVITVLPDIQRTGTQPILTLSDLVPPEIHAVEYRGQIYLRKWASPQAKEHLMALYNQYIAWAITPEALVIWLQAIERDTFVGVSNSPLAGQTLELTHAMTLRYITESSFNRALRDSGDGVSLLSSIETQAAQSNYRYFSRKYTSEIEQVSKKYVAHTPQDTELLLTLISRVNSDFSSSIEWGFARMNSALYNQARSELGLKDTAKTVADELAVVWHIYHTQIAENTDISAVATQAKNLNDTATYTSKNLDIVRQVRGIFFVLKTFTSTPTLPTEVQKKEYQQIIETRLGMRLDLDDPRVYSAYLNGAYLSKLQEVGIIPADGSLEPGDLLTMDDFVEYVNDLAGYLGIDGIELPRSATSPANTYKNMQSTITSLSSYFWYQARGNVTLCMVNVRNGLSRLIGVNILGRWDMVDIFRDGVETYVRTIRSDFEKAGAVSKYIGYDPLFGKTHFQAPEWANIGMLFTDTTRGWRWGHVSAIILAPNGEWFVKDDYYKWPLGAFKTVADYWSDKNPWIWKKYDLAKNPQKMQWALFFKGDISKIAFPRMAPLTNDSKIASK
jgi:hypothetical protein